MRWTRTAAAGCLGLALVLSACGAPSAGAGGAPSSSASQSATPTATPTAGTEPTPAPSTLLPAFASAQQAAIYSVQEWILLNKQANGDHSATVYESGACTPSAQHPECLVGGTMTMGDRAAYGQFTNSGTGGGSVCFGYVFQDAAGWHSLDAVCVQNGVNPVVGQSDAVTVSGGGCANVRQSPGLTGKVVACLADATRVQIDGGPNYVENAAGQVGFLWWHLAGKGWMAHQFLLNVAAGPCQEPQCALPPASCPATYSPSAMLTGSGSYHSTAAYDNLGLPPLTRQLQNNAAGFRGTMLCSGGTLAEIMAFMQVQLEVHGFHYTGSTACAVASYAAYECWNTGPTNRYDFVLGFNSAADWFAGFHNPDNIG
ncbi:MAG TPA: hypothetical protein VET26_07825 [Candidatus Sulfotelmatobacter sp.]|nr:hypothetical protein [Candidatus Sulfotelmatobacter sp.]